MRSVKIIGLEPVSQTFVNLVKGMEQVEVERFLSERSIESFYNSVLSRFARLDKSEFNVFILGPGFEVFADKLRAVITADVGWLATHLDDAV